MIRRLFSNPTLKFGIPFTLAVVGLAFYFWLLILAGLLLAPVAAYRRWLREQPGYVQQLSRWPGLGTPTALRLFFGTLIYGLLVGLVALLFLYLFLGEMIGGSPGLFFLAGLPGLAMIYFWLTGRWVFREWGGAPAVPGERRSAAPGQPLRWTRGDERGALVRTYLGLSPLDTIKDGDKRRAAFNMAVAALGPQLLPAYLLIVPAVLAGYLFGGPLAGGLGALLSLVPAYRRWLSRRPGYIHRLSMLKGWHPPTARRLFAAHLLWWVLPPLLLLALGLTFASPELRSFVPAFTCMALPGLALLLGWLLGNWQTPLWGAARGRRLSGPYRAWETAMAASVTQLAEGRLESAIAAVEEAHAFASAAFGSGHYTCAVSLDQLGHLRTLAGAYRLAEPALQEALAIRRHGLGSAHPAVGDTHHHLGLLYLAMGRYTAADEAMRAALTIARAHGAENNPAYARMFDELGQVYLGLDNEAVAGAFLYESLSIQERYGHGDGALLASTAAHLARVHTLRGDFETTDHFLARAEAQGETTLIRPRLLAYRAELCRRQGRYKLALSLQLEAVEVERALYGADHPRLARTLGELATLNRELGRHAEAGPLYRQSLALYAGAGLTDHPEYAHFLQEQALSRAAEGATQAALQTMAQALSLAEAGLEQTLTHGSESGRLIALQRHRAQLLQFLELVRQYGLDEPGTVNVAADLILRRKALVAEIMAVSQPLSGGDDRELDRAQATLHDLNGRIAEAALAGPGVEGEGVHRRRLGEWWAEKEQLEALLSQRLSYGPVLARIRAADLAAVRAALPAGSALMEYVYGPRYDFSAVIASGEAAWLAPGYLALLLPAADGPPPRLCDLGPAQPIDAALAALWRQEGEERALRDLVPMTAGRPEDDAQALLSQRLVAPLLEWVGDRQHLLLAPDGGLTQLSFAVLPLDDHQRLIDRYRISYLSTGRDLLRLADGSAANSAGAPLVLADPDYDTAPGSLLSWPGRKEKTAPAALGLRQSGQHFARLAGTRLEGEQVAALLGVEPRLGAEARESLLKRTRRPQILHIATHGFFLADTGLAEAQGPAAADRLARLSHQENPLLRSGLALAGANGWLQGERTWDKGEDGILTGLDVTTLDLLGTQLVVLSACETGLGQTEAGEGVFGLRRAFVLAGARTLVMSLWKVPDEQTQLLMVDFYRRLLAGQPRAEALRQAQLSLKADYPDPHYWGAFICQGDAGPLPGSAGTAPRRAAGQSLLHSHP